VVTLPDALDMMRRAGHICGKTKAAEVLASNIGSAFANIHPPQKRLRVIYLIWRKPFMAAASGTFIQEMLRYAGFDNCVAHLSRYPQINVADLQACDPDLMLLSSEPFPFSEKHIREIQEICPRAHVHLADGEMFSWYGPRMLYAPEYFQHLCRELDICQ
jgi:ABC-type Fe3+-hydroxamate transport system substrate-binding protein